MNLQSFFFIIFAITFINACKSPDNNLFHFDPRILEVNEITLSEIADEVSYIPLDNIIPLGEIYNIKFINGIIYYNSGGILEFDREGKFIRKIGSVGRGPGEYITYMNFCVDDKSGTIYVRDSNNVIKVFSRTGQFLRSFSLNEYGDFVENIGFYCSKLFIQYSVHSKNANFEWIFCDTLGHVIKKKERRRPAFITNWGGSKPIYMFENKLSYFNNFTDTIFSILPGLTEKPSIVISPGEHRLPKSNLTPGQLMSDKFLMIDKILETSHFFVITYKYKNLCLALVDKNNQKSFLIYLKLGFENEGVVNGIENDIDTGPYFLPKDYFTEDGREYMVGLVYPYRIKEIVISDEFKNSIPKLPENKKEFGKLANSLKETDNPVLMLVRLKK